MTAEHSRGSVVKPGQREEGRDTSALCRLASSPGLRVGVRDGVPERPLSTLLPFLGRELGCFPFLCDKPGWQAFWGQRPQCSVAARGRGRSNSLCLCAPSPGGWWKDGSLALSSESSWPGLSAHGVVSYVTQRICMQLIYEVRAPKGRP